MNEGRDRQPQPESGPPQLIAPDGLSPVQKAQYYRNAHAAGCQQCADIDRRLCPEGERLLQAWQEAMDAAYRQLHRGAL